MKTVREVIGNAVRLLGWAVVVIGGLTFTYLTFQTLLDRSVSGFAMFVVLEGALVVLGGFILIWIGRSIRGKVQEPLPRLE